MHNCLHTIQIHSNSANYWNGNFWEREQLQDKPPALFSAEWMNESMTVDSMDNFDTSCVKEIKLNLLSPSLFHEESYNKSNERSPLSLRMSKQNKMSES